MKFIIALCCGVIIGSTVCAGMAKERGWLYESPNTLLNGSGIPVIDYKLAITGTYTFFFMIIYINGLSNIPVIITSTIIAIFSHFVLKIPESGEFIITHVVGIIVWIIEFIRRTSFGIYK